MSKPALAIATFALSLIAMRALAADPPATSATPAAPPPGPGLDLINQRCGFCHSTAQVFTQHKSAEAWAATVQAMADRGAEVSPEEMKVIVDYLSKNYSATPPSAPRAASR